MYRHSTDQTGTPLRARNTNPESGGCKLVDQNEVGGSTAPKNNRKSTSRSKNSPKTKIDFETPVSGLQQVFFNGQMPKCLGHFRPVRAMLKLFLESKAPQRNTDSHVHVAH